MEQYQVVPLLEPQKTQLPSLTRDLHAALSYVSFYSADSPFVLQAVQKLHKSFQKFLAVGDLLFHVKEDRVWINDQPSNNLEDLDQILQERDCKGFRILQTLTYEDLFRFLKKITFPVDDPRGQNADDFASIQVLSDDKAEPSVSKTEERPSAPTLAAGSFSELEEKLRSFGHDRTAWNAAPAAPASTYEAALSFLTEAWEFSQLQKRSATTSSRDLLLAQSFDNLFHRLLDRLEKIHPELKEIYRWFNAATGEFLESSSVTSMMPLLENAVKNDRMRIFFDPTTEGLVSDCLAHWGSDGKQDLVEKTVRSISEGFLSDPTERTVALAHLRDARPWVSDKDLCALVLERLGQMLSKELSANLYQNGLLLAWDLVEPVLRSDREKPALQLLSLLHFHADEESADFPERNRIARHWLFERSTSELIRRFVEKAYGVGELSRYPLLAEMAAPILVPDFLQAAPEESVAYLRWFREMKEPVRSVLAQRLADAADEQEVRELVPVFRVCGMDPALSLQLCAWIGRGTRDFKKELISLIEEVGESAAGPALRLALFDDDESIACMAARVTGKIDFVSGIPSLMKAAQVRGRRFPNNDAFLETLCETFGKWGNPRSLPFLEEIARKKGLLKGKNYSMGLRVKAIEALTRLNQPEAWQFLESLTSEKNPELQEALDKIIQEKTQAPIDPS